MTGNETPVLERERIDRMRAHVMATVEAQRGRRRRARVVLGGLAAASLVVVAGAVGVGVGSGLQGSSSEVASSSDLQADESGGVRTGAVVESGEDEKTVRRETVVTTGSASVRVDDVGDALAAVRAFVTLHGGRVDGETVEQGSAPFADLTVRVPGAQVSALRDVLEDEGTVQSMTVQREDIGDAIADVDARIASLETSIRRLRAIVAEADTTADLLAAERQLTQRQSDLESLQAQRRVQADRTSLATISVSLYAKTAPEAVEPDGFRGGLTDGWNALVSVTNAVVAAAGFLVPWLVPLGLVAAVVLLGRRRRARR